MSGHLCSGNTCAGINEKVAANVCACVRAYVKYRVRVYGCAHVCVYAAVVWCHEPHGCRKTRLVGP